MTSERYQQVLAEWCARPDVQITRALVMRIVKYKRRGRWRFLIKAAWIRPWSSGLWRRL